MSTPAVFTELSRLHYLVPQRADGEMTMWQEKVVLYFLIYIYRLFYFFLSFIVFHSFFICRILLCHESTSCVSL